MFSGEPIGHCFKTMAPKLKSEKEETRSDENCDRVNAEEVSTKNSGEERLRPPEDVNDEVKGMKRDSGGAMISLTKSDDAVSESPDQRELDPHLSIGGSLVERSESKAEDQPRMGLQVGKHTFFLILLFNQVRRDLVEETLVEEQEEGELAHLSWVRNYDRPLPQVSAWMGN